jgi:hypothetical protein
VKKSINKKKTSDSSWRNTKAGDVASKGLEKKNMHIDSHYEPGAFINYTVEDCEAENATELATHDDGWGTIKPGVVPFSGYPQDNTYDVLQIAAGEIPPSFILNKKWQLGNFSMKNAIKAADVYGLSYARAPRDFPIWSRIENNRGLNKIYTMLKKKTPLLQTIGAAQRQELLSHNINVPYKRLVKFYNVVTNIKDEFDKKEGLVFQFFDILNVIGDLKKKVCKLQYVSVFYNKGVGSYYIQKFKITDIIEGLLIKLLDTANIPIIDPFAQLACSNLTRFYKGNIYTNAKKWMYCAKTVCTNLNFKIFWIAKTDSFELVLNAQERAFKKKHKLANFFVEGVPWDPLPTALPVSVIYKNNK